MLSFWRNRGIEFDQIAGDNLSGRRGSLWKNLYTFDMSKVKAALSISVDDARHCSCELDVSTDYQIITVSNLHYWKLELLTFSSYMLDGSMREPEWIAFREENRKSASRWLWSGGIADRAQWPADWAPRRPWNVVVGRGGDADDDTSTRRHDVPTSLRRLAYLLVMLAWLLVCMLTLSAIHHHADGRRGRPDSSVSSSRALTHEKPTPL